MVLVVMKENFFFCSAHGRVPWSLAKALRTPWPEKEKGFHR
jgi:hypothetical protein